MERALTARREHGFEDAAATTRAAAHLVWPLPQEARLSLITTLPGLYALESQWRELESRTSSVAGLFQNYDWVSAWARTYLAGQGNSELCIIAGFSGARLAFVLPLMKVRHWGLDVVKWLTEPFGQYGDILIAPGECPMTWMAQSVHLLGKLKHIDVVRLRHVRADAHAAGFLKNGFVDALARDAAPALDLTAFATEADYDARYTPAQRKRRKKIRKSLEALGPVEFAILPPGTLSDRAIHSALAEKNRWLSQRGRHNRVLKCPAHAVFLKSLSRLRSENFACTVTELSAGGHPVSWEIGFDYRGTHYGYITSHKTELTDLSPGRLHMDLSQRRCLKDGLARFDLMVPNDDHKESWSSEKIATADYFHPMSPAGRAFGHAYLRGLRPLLRKAYYSAPIWLLRVLSKSVARATAVS
jgi:CelD/BcsL family acetyltransferase involved in cellulose biosynthesis